MQPTENSPPVTVTEVAAVIPVIVTGADSMTVALATFAWSTKANASGVVSAGTTTSGETPKRTAANW